MDKLSVIPLLDDVKESLEANISARRRLTPEPENKIPQLTAAEAAEALNGWVYKQPGMATKADCLNVLDRMMTKFGYQECKVLLQRYAVESLNDLWIGQYQSLVDFGNATLEYNYPPSGSWTTDNVPTYLAESTYGKLVAEYNGVEYKSAIADEL